MRRMLQGLLFETKVWAVNTLIALAIALIVREALYALLHFAN
jgi:hypothetical protein